MFPVTRILLAVGAAAAIADAPADLKVLRAIPAGVAAPTDVVTVTFDRPVAGSLDRSVDPAGLLAIAPAIAGRAEWRDPVTLVFRPAAPLPSDAAYTVTVANTFAAMDGSRLREPYRFTFRVRGPRVLAGSPVSPNRQPRWLAPRDTFELVVDAPLDAARAAGAVYVEMSKQCRTPGVIRLRLIGQRAIGEQDGWEFREAGGWDRNRAADPLRRVVGLVPERPLPRGCDGHLVIPAAFDAASRNELRRWAFSTYGDFRVAAAACGWVGAGACPTGPVIARFSTPVRGSEVARYIRVIPAATLTVRDTADVRAEWVLDAELRPRTTYALVADTAIRDAFGQRLTGNTAHAFRSTGYSPSVSYAFGRAVVERVGLRTLGVTYINVDTLDVTVAPVPDSLIPAFMGSQWSWGDRMTALLATAPHQRIAVRSERDKARVYGVRLPVPEARRGAPTLMAVRVSSPRLDTISQRNQPVALVQVTDLGVHAKVGAESGEVWVTGASDGAPRAGAAVVLRDMRGRPVATGRTDAAGTARLASYRVYPRDSLDADAEQYGAAFDGWVEVTLGDDRALVGIHEYDPDLSPWNFNVSAAWGGDRLKLAGAVFTERGIYRPGEPLYAKAIVRTGMLGRLDPAAADSVRWRFHDRDGEGMLRDTVTALSGFGTADQRITLPTDARLGSYRLTTEVKRQGRWSEIGATSYRVAEYRPPEFQVDVAAPGGARFAGDSLRAAVEARYLFGAPMGRAAVTWTLRQTRVGAWDLEIPNTEGFHVGETGRWWEELGDTRPGTEVVGSGTDTLDAAGRLELALRLGPASKGRTARATVEATVVDVNRQTVSASASLLVHPAEFYLGGKPDTKEYFWRAGQAVSVGVIAVRPDGARLPGVRVTGILERQEWHQVRRERGGYAETVGEWVTDTVGRCAVTTGSDAVPCRFTPPAGGSYTVRLAATDAAGRSVSTSFFRWAVGTDWVPWYDETRFRMDVVPDRTRYAVGDTATVLFASPFTDAEAWITVEREGLLEQRRLRLTSGTTTLKLPITEAHAPNVFVGIVVARGRSAAPGPLDDPGRPTLRVGYAELRVTPERKRLAVDVAPLEKEYRPGDTARVRLRVKDATGAGHRAEVTLWAVDEGVLSLTGYRTPDPLDLIYQPRGLGLRLASNLTSVSPQVPEGETGNRAPGGGGGLDNADVLRSRFQTTAFFLGSIVTDARGEAVAAAKLPDNLTTFRVMAVAVTAGDRYGSGHAPLLVTRPLVARPALPRFVRPGDRFSAGVVVNHRMGGTPEVQVSAAAEGTALQGAARQRATLEAGRGREVRFGFVTPASRRSDPGDSASFRFGVTGKGATDAVRLSVPVRPAFHTRSYTVAGVLHDTASARFELPADVDADRSRLTLSFGTSPLAAIRAAREWLRVYPYYCTEQVASAAQPLIALYRARAAFGADSALLGIPAMRRDIGEAVAMIQRRQGANGGIGMWTSGSWTTPWLSAYAGQVLLDARAAGIPVSDSVLARLGRYLQESLADRGPVHSPVATWYDSSSTRLADRVAAVDYLSRAGLRDKAVENELVRNAAQLAWEDRVRLARVLADGGDRDAARRLLAPAWAAVKIEGRTAVLPESARRAFYFYSPMRPAAYLLRATLAVDPTHRLVGPLVETLVQQGRGAGWLWNTQDYGTAMQALAEFQLRQSEVETRTVRVRAGTKVVLQGSAARAAADSSVPLAGLLERGADGGQALRLALDAPSAGGPVFYYLTVTEVPRTQPVRPDWQGISVERWYERYSDGKPAVSVAEGELVRVRLRVTVPSERHFVVLDDALPAGLEAIDLSLRTVGGIPGPGAADTASSEDNSRDNDETGYGRWAYGSWDAGWWSPFEHREIRDDRVVYYATLLWKGSYTTSYLARATTPGIFVRPPAHAEEMYNPAVFGRTDGGVFTVDARK